MRWLVEKLQAGETVRYRPRGNSMTPIVNSGDEVIVAPLDPDASLKKGDIVYAKVGKYHYLHLVKATDRHRVQIANNHGHVNGWTPRDKVYGILTEVKGKTRRKK